MSGVYVQWPASGGGGSSGSVTANTIGWSVGALDGQTATARGGSVSSTSLFFQSATASAPGVVSSGNQTFAGVKTFNVAPNFASLSVSAPLKTDGSSNVVVGSISLTNDVTGNLPVSQTSGSVSLVNQVVGNLPLTQTSGSLSLVTQVNGNLPLAQTSGSLSLVNQVVGNLPLSQTSGSISLTNQVSGVLPATNMATTHNIGSVTVTSSVGGAAYTLTLPGAQGGSGQVPTNDGAGKLAWATPFPSPTIGSTGFGLVVTPSGTGGVGWQDTMSPVMGRGYGLFVGVAGGNLKIDVLQPNSTLLSNGLTTAAPASFSFNGGAGQSVTRYVTGSLSLVLQGGTNLGMIQFVYGVGAIAKLWIYAIDLQDGNGGVSLGASTSLLDESKTWANCFANQTATITVGTASVIAVSGMSGLPLNSAVSFSTQGSGSGALPAPLQQGTYYYAGIVGTTSITVSSVPGGPAINTSGSQLGVHTLRVQSNVLVTGSQTSPSATIKTLGYVTLPVLTTVSGSFSSILKYYCGGPTAGSATPPKIQVLSTASFVYCPTYSCTGFKVTAIGGGGGGGSITVDGANGANTVFGSGSATLILIAGAGSGGAGASANLGGAGGTPSGGDVQIFGGWGGGGIVGTGGVGGLGGNSMFGGGGGGGGTAANATAAGQSGAPNTGGGGGGASIGSSSRQGGGAGAAVIKFVSTVGASYNYTVGDGGIGSGSGGKGGTGVIVLEEYFT